MALLPDETGKTGGSTELKELMDGLSDGLVTKSPATGIQEIEFWQEKLAAANDPELAPILENLGRLKDALSASDLDGETIGHALILVGESVETFAEDYEGTASDELERIGHTLRSEGSGIGGNMIGDGDGV